MPQPQKTTTLDLDLYNALLRRTKDFGETISDVIRRELRFSDRNESNEFNELDGLAAIREQGAKIKYEQLSELIDNSGDAGATPILVLPESVPALISFVKGPEFQSHRKGLDRYLALLSWLHSRHPERFAAIQDIPFGGRKYFSHNASDITVSAGVTAKKIPKSDFFALGTLSNDAKRKIIDRLLNFFGYPPDQVKIVLREMPESASRSLFG